MIMSTSISGMLFATFAGQPLSILGATGPFLAYTLVVYDLSIAFELEFMPFYWWTCMWCAVFTILVAVTDLCALMKHAARDIWVSIIFPECVARVPVSFGGLGVRLCSRKVVSMLATVRNRSRTVATVCVRAVRLSTVASASGLVLKVCEVDHCRRSYIGLCRGGVCVSDLCRRSYIGVCRGGVCVSDLCRRSYIGVWRGGVSVSEKLSV